MANQLCVDIINITKKLYRSYAFLEIPKEEFQNLMKEVVKSYMSSKQARRSKTPEIFFKKCFEYELNVYMGNLASTEEVAKQYANQYINGIWPTEASHNSIQHLRHLSYFLSFMQYEPNLQFCIDLIRENKSLNSILRSVLNYTFTKSGQKYLQETITGKILKAYCVVHDIPFKVSAKKRPQKKFGSGDLSLYFNDIRELGEDLLTLEEERKLGFQILKGDKIAKEKLIIKNLKLVVKIANRFDVTRMSMEDYIQEGNIGLINAVETFDITLGIDFSAYAIKCIKGYILRFIKSKNNLIRIPEYWTLKMRSYHDFCDHYRAQFEKEPTMTEIAQALQVSETTIKNLQTIPQLDPMSLDQQVEDDSGAVQNLIETIASPNNDIEDFIFHYSLNKDLTDVLSNSGHTVREIAMADLYYGQELSPKEMIPILGVSSQRIDQLNDMLIERFRKTEKTEVLADYMDEPDKMRSQLQNYQATLKGKKQCKIEIPNVRWAKLYASLFTEIFGIIKKLDSNANQTLILTVQQLLASFEQLLSDCGLTREEIELLRMHYFNASENLSCVAIGTLYEINHKEVSTILNRALKKLEYPENIKKIREYNVYYENIIRKLNAYRKYYQLHQFGELKTYDEFVYMDTSDNPTIFEKVFFKK